jgi:hypothetical protein
MVLLVDFRAQDTSLNVRQVPWLRSSPAPTWKCDARSPDRDALGRRHKVQVHDDRILAIV